MPLRLRLALIFAAATAAVLTLGGFVFIHQLTADIRNTVDTTLTTRAADIANALAQPGEDPVGVLETSRHDPLPLGGSEAQIVDQQGNVLAASGTKRSPLLPFNPSEKIKQGSLHFSSGSEPFQRYVVVGTSSHGKQLAIVVRSDLQAGDAAVDRAERLLLFGGVPLVLLAGLAGWLIAGAGLRPVERLRSQVELMTDEEVGPNLDVPGTRDEISALATTMNDLLARVRQARSRERHFVAEAGHELRTPLAILQGELELADRPGRSVTELRETLHIAQEEALRLSRLAEDLLFLARTDSGSLNLQRHHTDLAALVEESIANFGRRDRGRAITFEVHNDVQLTVNLDPDRFRQAVDNLIDNALRHAPDGSTIEVRIERRGPEVSCTVRDHGAGFPPDFIERALDRFAKPTSQDDGGAGLGLSIVRSIATAHGGRAWVANCESGGAEAGFAIPVSGWNDELLVPQC